MGPRQACTGLVQRRVLEQRQACGGRGRRWEWPHLGLWGVPQGTARRRAWVRHQGWGHQLVGLRRTPAADRQWMRRRGGHRGGDTWFVEARNARTGRYAAARYRRCVLHLCVCVFVRVYVCMYVCGSNLMCSCFCMHVYLVCKQKDSKHHLYCVHPIVHAYISYMHMHIGPATGPSQQSKANTQKKEVSRKGDV